MGLGLGTCRCGSASSRCLSAPRAGRQSAHRPGLGRAAKERTHATSPC